MVPAVDPSKIVIQTPRGPIADPIMAASSTSPSPIPSLLVSLKNIQRVRYKNEYPRTAPIMLALKETGARLRHAAAMKKVAGHNVASREIKKVSASVLIVINKSDAKIK